MSKYFQLLYYITFAVLILLLSVFCFAILTSKEKSVDVPMSFPKAPAAVALESIDVKLDPKTQEQILTLNKYKLDIYNKQVSAYSEEIIAYKIFLENQRNIKANSSESLKLDLYKNLIHDSFIPLLTTLILTLVAYVFVKEGAELLFEFKKEKLKRGTQSNDLIT